MKKIHFVDPYLMNPTHPITISVIGCGGTGSYVVTQLAKMAVALKKIHDIQIKVYVYDDDVVQSHNVGRQLFSPSDIGEKKSDVIVSRVNRFYGLNWVSFSFRVNHCPETNFVLTCTDNVESRRVVEKALRLTNRTQGDEYKFRMYWMDFGNAKDYGQYVLSTFGKKIEQPKIKNTEGYLKNIFHFNPDLQDDPEEPSCSMRESLGKQDLFINLQLAVSGIGLIWKLLNEHQIAYHGQFINLETGQSRPIEIK